MTLSSRQRTWLTAAALIGLLGPNGVFIYFAVFRWHELLTALSSPVTAAFVSEAFLVTALLAVFFARHPMGRWGWRSLVVMSLIGGLGFGIPAYVLLNSPRSSSQGG